MIIGIASADFLRADKTTNNEDAWGGSGFARVGQYVPYLRAAGHTVVAGTLWKDEEAGHLFVEDATGTRFLPDIIYSQRLMHKGLAEAYKMGRNAGQIIVCDVDDWYWGLSPQNAAFLASHPKHNDIENTTAYKESLAAASYLTVSTPFLYEKVSWGPNVQRTLLPNYIEVSRFNPVAHTDTDCPEVGWAGSTSHRSGDIEQLSGVLAPMSTAGKIKIVHAGHWEGSPTYASKLGVPDEMIFRTEPRAGHNDYPKILTFEVGVVPLRNIPFNEAKSDIKGLEYAASGIPFVASKLPSYSTLHSDWSALGKAGFFIAKNPQQWVSFLDKLRNPALRKELSEALLENVKTRDTAIGAADMVAYFESLKPR